MGLIDDAAALRADIAELRALADSQPGLSADARAVALASMVSAKATLLAVETFQG